MAASKQDAIVKRFAVRAEKFSMGIEFPDGKHHKNIKSGGTLALTKSEWEYLRGQGWFDRLVKSGKFVQMDDDMATTDIDPLDVAGQTLAIKTCQNIETLCDLAKRVSSPELRKVLRDRITGAIADFNEALSLMPPVSLDEFNPRTANATALREAVASIEDSSLLTEWLDRVVKRNRPIVQSRLDELAA